jgi:hypothetical protein
MKNKNKSISFNDFLADIKEIVGIEDIISNDFNVLFEVDGKQYKISEYKLSGNKNKNLKIILDPIDITGKYFDRPTEKNINRYKVDILEDNRCHSSCYCIVDSKTDAEIIDDLVCDVLGRILTNSRFRYNDGNYQYIFSNIEFDLDKLKKMIKDNKGYVDWYTLYKCSKNN